MGQHASSEKHPITSSPNFNPQVEVIQSKTYDPHYGEIKIVKDKKTSEHWILKEIVVNAKEAFQKELTFYNKRVTFKHPNVVSIIGYTSEEKNNFCSTYFKISVYIEVLDYDLLTELKKREVDRQAYSENELLYIAYSLISGLSEFQTQGHSHGDIRTANIFIKDRDYKLSDPSLASQKDSNGLTLAIFNGTKTYLSPELLKQVPKQDFEIKSDKYKNDVFSLGAVLLGLATLSNSEDLYSYANGTLNTSILQERLDAVKFHYTDFTYDLIKSMLIIDPLQRPDSLALANKLAPYQTEIRAGSTLRFGQGTQTTTGYNVTVHHEEVVKRSAPTHHVEEYKPVSFGNDDLDARIRAALERSQQTFKTIDSQYTPPPTTSYTVENYTVTERAYEVPKNEGEVVKSSYLQETIPVQTTSYVSSNYTPYYEPTTTSYTTNTAYYTAEPSKDITTGEAFNKEVERIVKAAVPGTDNYSYNTSTSYVPTTTTYTTSYVPATTTYTNSYVPVEEKSVNPTLIGNAGDYLIVTGVIQPESQLKTENLVENAGNYLVNTGLIETNKAADTGITGTGYQTYQTTTYTSSYVPETTTNYTTSYMPATITSYNVEEKSSVDPVLIGNAGNYLINTGVVEPESQLKAENLVENAGNYLVNTGLIETNKAAETGVTEIFYQTTTTTYQYEIGGTQGGAAVTY